MTKKRFSFHVLSYLIAASLPLAIYVYSSSGWNYAFSSVSPDGRYRVDLYTANRWQWVTHIISWEEPGFARLTRTTDNKSLGTSQVITLVDSNVTWLPDVVVVGTQTDHKLPDGDWMDGNRPVTPHR